MTVRAAKRCKSCGTEKAVSQFYRHKLMRSGRDNTCIECRLDRAAERRRHDGERMRAYDRARAQLPHRVAARHAYQQTVSGRSANRRASRWYNWTKRRPDSPAARENA